MQALDAALDSAKVDVEADDREFFAAERLALDLVHDLATRPTPRSPELLAMLHDQALESTWLETLVIHLLGLRRYITATPEFVALLGSSDDTRLVETLTTALMRCADGDVAKRLRNGYRRGDEAFRSAATIVLGNCAFPDGLLAIQSALREETSDDLKCSCYAAWLSLWHREGFGVALAFARRLGAFLPMDVRYELPVFAKIWGEELPEADAWRAAARAADEAADDEYDDAADDDFDHADEESTAATAKVGRNEPCPCGSGRKFKKCCLAGDDAPR
jgi:hypothetical protein